MSNDFTYRRGSELPGIRLPWQDADGNDLDLSTGYTFSLELLASDGTDAAPSPTLTGGVGYVDIAWTVDDLDIAPGLYTLWLTATETATTKDRVFSPRRPPRVLIR